MFFFCCSACATARFWIVSLAPTFSRPFKVFSRSLSIAFWISSARPWTLLRTFSTACAPPWPNPIVAWCTSSTLDFNRDSSWSCSLLTLVPHVWVRSFASAISWAMIPIPTNAAPPARTPQVTGLPNNPTAVLHNPVLAAAPSAAAPVAVIPVAICFRPLINPPPWDTVFSIPLNLPIPLATVPIPLAKTLMTLAPVPNTLSAGPIAAAIAPHPMMLCCCSVDISLNFLAMSDSVCSHGLAASKPLFNAFSSGPPNSIAISVSLFLKILSCDSVVS